MTAKYIPARGERGDVTDSRTLTGQKYRAGLAQKQNQDDARRRTQNCLTDGDFAIVTGVVSGRAYAVPREIAGMIGADND
jgi:hypothetical protein